MAVDSREVPKVSVALGRLEIRLFGHLELVFDGAPWRFSAPPRAAGLLAYLVMHSGESISRAALATQTWPDDAEDEARGKLRRHLHRILRALPPTDRPWLDVTASTVRCDIRPDLWIDVAQFEEMSAVAARASEAVELYRGDFLDAHYDEWILMERERLRSRFLELCYDAARSARRNREFDATIRYAERMLSVDEWREDALRLMMTARYESGDRSGALASYERFATRLRSEMGVEPMPETLALRAAILENGPVPGQLSSFSGDAVASKAGTPFVGRASEIDTLNAAWLRAARGRGTTIFVGGVAGIGKSALVSELAAIVNGQGGRTLLGGTSNPEAYPYEPLADSLRRSLTLVSESHLDKVWLSSLAGLIPELHGALPGLPVAESLEPAHARTRLFEAIVRAVEQLSRVRPLLLVLEDVHWAQTATFDALEFLARRIGMIPVLVVATYRSEETNANHPATVIRSRLQSERRATTIGLSPLDADEVSDFVRKSRSGASEELIASIHRLSEGNPLFANQLLRGFEESGELPSERVAVRSVSEAILARYRALDERARTLAETAATCGRSFTVDTAARVIGCPEDEVLDALGTLLDRGIVREAGGTTFAYAFTHALIGASIYDATPQPFRVARHRRLAQLLSQAQESDPQTQASIARHWEGAGEFARAAEAFVRAAQAALDVYAREEAVEYARAAHGRADRDATRFRALQVAASAELRSSDAESWDADLVALEALAAHLGVDERAEALRLRERYAAQTGDLELHSATVAKMMTLAQECDDDLMRAKALLARAYFEMRSVRLENSHESLRKLLELAASTNDRELILRTRELLIQILVRLGDMDEARVELALQREALERDGSSVERRLALLNPESILAAQLEDGELLERVGAEMLEVARAAGDSYYEARAHTVMAHSAYIRQDFPGIRRHYERAIERFERVGDVRSLHATYLNWGEFEWRLGRFEDSMRQLERATALSTQPKTRTPDALSCIAVNRAAVLIALKRYDAALASAREAQSIVETIPEPRYRGEASIVLGIAELLTGSTQAALTRLDAAAIDCLEREDWHNASDALCWLIKGNADAGKASRAVAYRERLVMLFEQHRGAAVHPERICWTLGRLADALGETAESDAWIRQGLAALHETLAKLEDSTDREAYSSLPFNRALLEAEAALKSAARTRVSRQKSS